MSRDQHFDANTDATTAAAVSVCRPSRHVLHAGKQPSAIRFMQSLLYPVLLSDLQFHCLQFYLDHKASGLCMVSGHQLSPTSVGVVYIGSQHPTRATTLLVWSSFGPVSATVAVKICLLTLAAFT